VIVSKQVQAKKSVNSEVGYVRNLIQPRPN